MISNKGELGYEGLQNGEVMITFSVGYNGIVISKHDRCPSTSKFRCLWFSGYSKELRNKTTNVDGKPCAFH